MGCSNSKEEDKSRSYKKEYDEKCAENERLKRELDTVKAAPTIIATPSPTVAHTAGNPVFQIVVTPAQAVAIAKIPGVAFKYAQGTNVPLMPGPQNVLVVTCPDAEVANVIKEASSVYDVPRPPKPVPDAPPSVEKPVVEEEVDTEKPPKVVVPESTIPAKTDINLLTWDGKVTLHFVWPHAPSPYSEWSDPSGQNWWNTTNVRRAPDCNPKKVSLQYRRGFSGEWFTIPCTVDEHGAKCQLVLPVDEVTPLAFRGFQSRWVVDGERYLSPLQLAPTLQSKLMAYPMVRNAVKALPEDKQSRLENIPDENLRKAVLQVENIIPMNTWDFNYGLTLIPGAQIDNEHIMTVPEKVEWIAKQKAQDPAIVSEVRKTILKSPILAANAALSTVGIKLDVIVENIDFFLPKYSDPDFDVLEGLEASMAKWENLRRDMQTDVNGLYPAYQHGIRVSFPSSRVLRDAITAKRPYAGVVLMPIEVSWVVDDADQTATKHAIQFVYWEGDYAMKTVVACEAETEEETFGPPFDRQTRQLWKKYVAQLKLPKGMYRYHWVYDGANYFNNGAAYGAKFKPETAYTQFTVDANVTFGIGVPM